MKKNIQEQTVDLDVVTAREIENSTSNTNTNTSKIDTEKTDTEKTDTSKNKLQPGKRYKLDLKSTRLYYFMNNKFMPSDYKWVAPNSMYIKYITTSKQNKNWIFVEFSTKDGPKKFWAPLDKITKITPL